MKRPARTTHADKPQKVTYTVNEFAALSGISESTLYRHLREGLFEGKHVKSGHTYRISKSWADDALGIREEVA